MIRYYIPIGNNEFLCVQNDDTPACVVRGTPDPFSRVAAPGIRWSLVREDLPYLTNKQINRAKRSRIAYTRLYEEP